MAEVSRAAMRVAAATAGWAIVHSLLASGPAKAGAERLVGTHNRNGLYRTAYNGVAVATFALLVAYVRRQPCRALYCAPHRWAALMRLGQAFSALYAAWGTLQVGIGGMSGLTHFAAWLAGERRIEPEPEGQTPAPHRLRELTRTGRTVGPFVLTRQALNFFLLPLLWLNPRMTTRLAAFNAVVTVYAYVGSLHAERRLRRRYGRSYAAAYAGRGVPFFFPRGPRPR